MLSAVVSIISQGALGHGIRILLIDGKPYFLGNTTLDLIHPLFIQAVGTKNIALFAYPITIPKGINARLVLFPNSGKPNLAPISGVSIFAALKIHGFTQHPANRVIGMQTGHYYDDNTPLNGSIWIGKVVQPPKMSKLQLLPYSLANHGAHGVFMAFNYVIND